jgi:hypothetical protein
MNDHAESRIDQEGATGGRRFRIATIYGDNGFKIAEGLSLQAIKSRGDEIGAFVDRQSYGDAWSRHCASPQSYLTERTNALGANFGKVGCHGEFSGVDRMKGAVRRDTDLEATMQFARGIINISFAPCDDGASFNIHFGKILGV